MHTPITEKQIMQLNTGDALLIRGSFVRVYSCGDMGIIVKETNLHSGEHQNHIICVSPSCVSLPSEPPTLVGSSPKYNPCRKFRKGDRVELKEEINGRRLSDFVTGLSLGKIYTVKADEDNCTVLIDSDNGLCRYSFIHLQLVTPVEELEPYCIADHIHGWIVYKDNPGNVVANFNKNHPHAKEAAEAERDRLNAEHRKEQK